MAVFTSNDIYFEVPLTGVAEDSIQSYLQERVDVAVEHAEIMSGTEQ